MELKADGKIEKEAKGVKKTEEVKEGKEKKTHKAVMELFDGGEKNRKEKKRFSLSSESKKALGLTLATIAVAGLFVFKVSNKTPQPASNVDVVAIVRKVNEENQKQTREMVNLLAKQIQMLTEVIKQQQELQKKQVSRKGKENEEQVKERARSKLSRLERERLLAQQKREMELQKALLRQYVQEIKEYNKAPSVSLAVEVEKVEKPVVKKKILVHQVYIPTGSVVRGRTVHTIPAPVERGILPLPPVLIKLEGDAYTANGFSVPLDGCYVVGKAQGDWNFIGGKEYARAEVEINKLVCVLGNGKVIERKVKGYVIDEESGLNGLLGKKMDISGEQMLKYTGINTLTGVFAGLADSARETISTKDGYTIERITEPFKYALFSSLNKSWEKFAKFYESRLRKINPVVLVPAKRKLQVVFLSGVDLGVTDEELVKWGI